MGAWHQRYLVAVFAERGAGDLTVPFPLSVALAAQMRGAGTDVTLIPYPGVDHPGVTRAGEADAFAAIARYFARN